MDWGPAVTTVHERVKLGSKGHVCLYRQRRLYISSDFTACITILGSDSTDGKMLM